MWTQTCSSLIVKPFWCDWAKWAYSGFYLLVLGLTDFYLGLRMCVQLILVCLSLSKGLWWLTKLIICLRGSRSVKKYLWGIVIRHEIVGFPLTSFLLQLLVNCLIDFYINWHFVFWVYKVGGHTLVLRLVTSHPGMYIAFVGKLIWIRMVFFICGLKNTCVPD